MGMELWERIKRLRARTAWQNLKKILEQNNIGLFCIASSLRNTDNLSSSKNRCFLIKMFSRSNKSDNTCTVSVVGKILA